MTVWQIKVFLYPSFDAFLVGCAECRMQICRGGKYCFEWLSRYSSTLFFAGIKTALSITRRLRPAKLQHGTKNSSDPNNLSDMFSSVCLQTLSISWCCCLSLPISPPLPVLCMCLYQTPACIPMTQEYSAVIWHWWGQMAACVFLNPISILSGSIVESVEKRNACKSGLRIPLRVWTCLLLKFKCKFCCKRSQTEECELQAASWCCFSNGAPLRLSYTLTELISALIPDEVETDISAFFYLHKKKKNTLSTRMCDAPGCMWSM